MERILYPVGHGAFFVEKILDYVVVYDCGSKDLSILLNQINSVFQDGEKIDALFISHFDLDHVNGIDVLANHMTSDTKVYVPFYYSKFKILYDRNTQMAIMMVENVLNQTGIRPILIKYSPLQEYLGYRGEDVDNRNRENDNDNDNTGEPYEDEEGNLIIESGTRIPLSHIGGKKPKIPYSVWEYVPFMIHDDQKIFNAFQNKASKQGINLNDLNKWPKVQIDKLKKIYHDRKVCKYPINDNSLILLSHAIHCFHHHWFEVDVRINQYNLSYYNHCSYIQRPHCNCGLYCCDGSCLYTGDSKLKRSSMLIVKQNDYEIFLDRLRNYTSKILLYQIPHHGSSNNSNLLSLSDNMSELMFCNYSSKSDIKNTTFIINKVRSKVLKKIFDITEYPGSKLTMDIFIH